MTEGLYFDRLEIENFKSIKSKTVEIGGRSMVITGENGAGKSSIIQALLSGIDPKQLPSDVITSGERKGSTKVKIKGVLNGVEEEYLLETYFTPANQKGRLVLYNKNGDKVNSPKSVLDSIIGNISFDIFKFLNSKKADQIKILKDLSGVSKEVDILDIERKKLYEERTFINRKVEEQEAIMNNHGLSQEEIEKYSTPIDISTIQKEMDAISQSIATWNDVKSKTEKFKESALSCAEKIGENTIEIKSLEEKIANLMALNISLQEEAFTSTENHNKGLAWLEKNIEPSAKAVSDKLNAATTHNANHEKVKGLIEKQKALMEDKQKSQKLTNDLVSIDDKKVNLIKNSKLPIPGLTFDENNIYLNNLPFEEGQVNTSTLLDVSAEIGMALNPNLKTIFIHEGSLFDKKHFNALIKRCEEKGYRVIAEVVNDQNDVGIEFIEYENN